MMGDVELLVLGAQNILKICGTQYCGMTPVA